MASSSPSPPHPPLSPSSSLHYSPTHTSASDSSTSALESLRGLLRELLRITTTDGRVFIGTFAGTDKPLNIILVNAEEYRVGTGENADGRYVGQVMLPWKIIVKVETHVQPDKRSRAADAGMYI